jgi:hypothetical protein
MKHVISFLVLSVLLSLNLTKEFTPQATAAPADGYILSTDAKTSAGVYKLDGTLVRTLWSGVLKTAGSYPVPDWDGLDDDGNQMPDDQYVISIIENNCVYSWSGVIGNTSDHLTGSSVHRAMYGFHDMCIVNRTAYVALGYNEQYPAIYKFNLNTPQQKQWILDNPKGNGTAEYVEHCATDGERIYWASLDPISGGRFHFVFSTKVADDGFYYFPGAQVSGYQLTWGRYYPSVIDLQDNSNAKITGIAVQTNGNYLFVAHGQQNTIKVFNKLTGDFVRDIPFSDPKRLLVVESNFIWICSSTNRLEKYTINADGTITTTGLTLNGLSNIADFAISPDNSTLSVVDRGAESQQIKSFSNATGVAVWQLGQAGGYAVDASVANDKFHLASLSETFPTYIAYQQDGSFWFGDGGNRRNLHFDNRRAYMEQIMFQNTTYDVSVDLNNPTRVFAGYREFKVDYGKVNDSIKTSWTLVKNWGWNIQEGFPNTAYGMNNVVTLSNNRTYCIMRKDGNPQRRYIAELVEGGILRMTNVTLEPWGNEVLTKDGYLYFNWIYGNYFHHVRKPIIGFDANNDPIVGTPEEVASAPYSDSDPATYTGLTGQITSTNKILSINSDHYWGTKWHLGAIKVGDSKLIWKTARELWNNDVGFPLGDRFDERNGVRQTRASVMVLDNNVVWHYPAEFYRGDQANMYNHMWENGLVIGQFGEIGAAHFGQEAAAGMAGNSFSPWMIKYDGRVFIWCNDEWDHAGVHLWEIKGLNTIKEHTMSITKSSGYPQYTYLNLKTQPSVSRTILGK